MLAPTLANAILDRVMHNSYKIQLQCESMRKIGGIKSWLVAEGLTNSIFPALLAYPSGAETLPVASLRSWSTGNEMLVDEDRNQWTIPSEYAVITYVLTITGLFTRKNEGVFNNLKNNIFSQLF